MSGPIKIKKTGVQLEPDTFHRSIRSLAQQGGRLLVKDVTPLTNNSGGTAGTINKVAAFVGAAASGSNLADKTTAEAAFTTVLNAVRELYAQSNALAALVGVDQITYSGGGAATDGTIAAVTVSVTGATTGVLVTDTNVFIAALNKAIYNVAVQTNHLCRATGNTELTMGFNDTLATTISAITIDGGTAASPAVTKAEADAALVVYRADIKTIGDLLNTIVNTQTPLVMAI